MKENMKKRRKNEEKQVCGKSYLVNWQFVLLVSQSIDILLILPLDIDQKKIRQSDYFFPKKRKEKKEKERRKEKRNLKGYQKGSMTCLGEPIVGFILKVGNTRSLFTIKVTIIFPPFIE